MEPELPIDRFGELLDELALADREHAGVFEHLEAGDPVHTGPLARDQILAMMAAVARGEGEVIRGMAPKPQPHPTRAGSAQRHTGRR